MTTREAERSYGIREAADVKGVSDDVIRKAIHASEPPYLKAKKVGQRYVISASALDEWFEGLPDG